MKNLKTALYIITIVIINCSVFSCSSNDELTPDTDPIIVSTADKISGTYSGIGKRMPNGISLGTYSACTTPPNWELNFVTGTSSVVVTKVDDNNVSIKIFGGAMLAEIYSKVDSK